MRKIIFTIVLFSIFQGYAQDYHELSLERNAKMKKGMLTLGAWSLANITVNPFFASNSSGADNAFYETNVYWNIGNLAIATVGYVQLMRQNMEGISLKESWQQQQRIEKTLLFNAGLDIAYMAAGLYLRERATNIGNRRMAGVGESVIFQGGFLLVFDAIFYLSIRQTGNKLWDESFSFSITPNNFFVAYNF